MKKYIKFCFVLLTISMLNVSVFANKDNGQFLFLDETLDETAVINSYPFMAIDNDSLSISSKLFKGLGFSTIKKTSVADNSPPKVSFYKKFGQEYSTKNERKAIKIKVEGVSRKKHITLRINGEKTRKFKFKKRAELIKTKVEWEAGENLVEVLVKNNFGKDVKVMTVFYDTPAAYPTVCITNPSGGVYATTEATKLVVAQLKNVTKAENINLLVNGLAQKFTYHAASGILRATVDLEYGKNEIYLEGYNWKGKKATDKKIVNRMKEGSGSYTGNEPYAVAPTIRVTAPYTAPFYTKDKSYVIKAKIKDVFDHNQIQFMFNGTSYYDFSYNPTTNQFTAYVNLRQGSNTFYIKAENANGSNAKNGTIIYQEDRYAQRPQINLIEPYNNQSVTRNYVFFKADVYNVTRRDQITLNVNGQRINNFSFNNRNTVTAGIDCLRAGTNLIELYATNGLGQTRKQVVVFYQKERKPIVRFQSPTTNNNTVTLTKTLVDLRAIVQYANRNDITLRVDGKSYLYRLQGTTLTAQFSLQPGRHNIQITARNAGGQTTKTITVFVSNPIAAPQVTIQRPRGRISVNVNRYTVKATVRNVRSVNEITVLVNNQPTTNFSFNPTSGLLTLNTLLKEGNNYIRIEARNAGGTNAKSTLITYKKPLEDEKVVGVKKEG